MSSRSLAGGRTGVAAYTAKELDKHALQLGISETHLYSTWYAGFFGESNPIGSPAEYIYVQWVVPWSELFDLVSLRLRIQFCGVLQSISSTWRHSKHCRNNRTRKSWTEKRVFGVQPTQRFDPSFAMFWTSCRLRPENCFLSSSLDCCEKRFRDDASSRSTQQFDPSFAMFQTSCCRRAPAQKLFSQSWTELWEKSFQAAQPTRRSKHIHMQCCDVYPAQNNCVPNFIRMIYIGLQNQSLHKTFGPPAWSHLPI